MISKSEIEKSISKETDKIWKGAPMDGLVSFVINEMNGSGTPLSENQIIALNKSLVYASKSITKNTITATLNVLLDVGILKGD